MLRRLDEAREHGWPARPASAATATATNDEPIDKDYIRQQVQALLPVGEVHVTYPFAFNSGDD